MREIVKWTILGDDHATGSDYVVIEWVVGVDRQGVVAHDRVEEWNLAALTEKDTEPAWVLWIE